MGAALTQSPTELCASLLRSLETFSSDQSAIAARGTACFGRNLDFFLPEDAHDLQPYGDGEGRLFVADARVDNREELISRFGWQASEKRCDAEILHAAWCRWGEGLIDHVLGDFALAAWDPGKEQLSLLRSPLGLKPLFYGFGAGWAAFASDPSALHHAGLVAKEPDLAFASRLIDLGPPLAATGIFANLRLVPQSHVAVLRKGELAERRLWAPQRQIRAFRSSAEAGEALRSELDRAVKAQMRRSGGELACQLSSGRDSSAVSTSAAREGDALLCFTGAPRAGFEAPGYRDHFADESHLAGKIAARYPNIRHVVARPPVGCAIAAMEAAHAVHHLPLLNPGNLPWWHAMEQQAAEHGVRVFLGAETGNFTISLGGPCFARDLLSEEGWLKALPILAGAAARDIRRSSSVADHLAGPSMSERHYRLLRRLAGRQSPPSPQPKLVRQPYAQPKAEAELRPMRSYRGHRASVMMSRDVPRNLSKALWALEHRDPTADRRLVELCYSIPAKHLFGAHRQRPAYAAAFNSRLPPELRNPVRRGWQGADWADHYPRDVVRAAFAKYHASGPVAELLDPDAIGRAMEGWPNRPSASVLAALSVASFLWVHFPP